MAELYDILIVGAGAAGLAAGIAAGEALGGEASGRRVVLFDGAASFGEKILLAGGGRCNITHDVVQAADYHGQRHIIRNILAGFDQPTTVEWFERMGLRLRREETGKLFPASDSAQTVLDALVARCSDLNVAIHTGRRVRQIVPPTDETGGAFVVHHDRGQTEARRVIVCAGGCSWPQTGSDGQAFEMLQSLGHAVTAPHPALVPLVLDEGFFHESVMGLSHEAEVSVFVAGKRVDCRKGSLLWTHFGVSGPVVLDISRHWVIAHETGQQTELRCSFAPGQDFVGVDRWLTDLALSNPHRRIDTLLATRMPRRLAETLARHSGVPGDVELSALRREHRRDLSHALVELPLPVTGHRGWDAAEVTAGGVSLREIDYRTMQSRRVAGLYLAGEMLDCDGRLGGFNLQWAWTTGNLAGRAAAASLGA